MTAPAAIRGQDLDSPGHTLLIPDAGVVGTLGPEHVAARCQAGKGGFSLLPCVHTVLIQALQHVGVPILRGIDVIERGKLDGKGILMMGQHNLLPVGYLPLDRGLCPCIGDTAKDLDGRYRYRRHIEVF